VHHPYALHPLLDLHHRPVCFSAATRPTAALIYLLHTVTSLLLETNPYIVVLAIDFSKAFDSVRHSVVLDKYSRRLNIPDNIYNWVESFFQDHSHSTRFGGQVSALKAISAISVSIIQGSVIGPVSYVTTASDLQPSSPANFIVKYADNTYVIIPAGNFSSGPAELTKSLRLLYWWQATHWNCPCDCDGLWNSRRSLPPPPIS